MHIQELLHSISERLAATATAKSVYGDPVTVGDRTVIPVATVRYGFGGGGGSLKDAPDAREGGGGGGGVVAAPSGALEVTADGTRFIPFVAPKTVGITLALGIAFGAALTLIAMNAREDGR